jgi:hypothetical protein
MRKKEERRRQEEGREVEKWGQTEESAVAC